MAIARKEATTGEANAAFRPALAVADAIVYEGYLLYPYRRSSIKNRLRWQFGVLTPRSWAEGRGLADTGVAGSAEGWWQQTECLLEPVGSGAEVDCRVRFLQLLSRSMEERLPDGTHRAADRVEIGSRLELGFEEAIPREFDVRISVDEVLAEPSRIVLHAPGGEEVETLVDGAGRPAGRRVLRRWPVEASLTASAAWCPTPSRLLRLRIRVENTVAAMPPETPRSRALRRSLIATHSLLAARHAWFVSLLDPPRWAEAEAGACENVRTFPVLAGGRDVVLSSPILLYDHPRIAPESPGDLHDATEIDEILSLRTHALTDAEKREARATDPRAAAIIDRVDAMPPEVRSRLHGAIRSLRTTPAARWEPPGDPQGVVVAGRRVCRGSRVRLAPRRRGTDPQDMFLEGRTARVEAVLRDVDGSHHLAVTLEGDPGAELDRWYGRFRYFAPAEVEPLADTGNAG